MNPFKYILFLTQLIQFTVKMFETFSVVELSVYLFSSTLKAFSAQMLEWTVFKSGVSMMFMHVVRLVYSSWSSWYFPTHTFTFTSDQAACVLVESPFIAMSQSWFNKPVDCQCTVSCLNVTNSIFILRSVE